MQILTGKTFLAGKGAMVLTDGELAAVVHALVEEYDRMFKAGADHYGELSITELHDFFLKLREYQEKRA